MSYMKYIEFIEIMSLAITYSVFGGIWLFFFLHALQRIENPVERFQWIIFMISLNILAIPFYFLMKYLPLKRKGKGSLLTKISYLKSKKMILFIVPILFVNLFIYSYALDTLKTYALSNYFFYRYEKMISHTSDPKEVVNVLEYLISYCPPHFEDSKKKNLLQNLIDKKNKESCMRLTLEHLKKITGRDLENDPERWIEFYRNDKNDPRANQ